LLEKGKKKTANVALSLNNPEHLHLFTLWWSLRGGMAGESLYDLWRLSREPGSAALFEDILSLVGRLETLRDVTEWLNEPW